MVIAVRKPLEYTLTPGEVTALCVMETVLEPLPEALDVEVVVDVVVPVPFACVPDAPLELPAEAGFD